MKHILIAVIVCLLAVLAPVQGVHASTSCAMFADGLKEMVIADQAIRSVLSSMPAVRNPKTIEDVPRLMRYADVVDKANTARLKDYLKVCGWPKRSTYGAAASHNAWLLAQHADRDRAFQREVLKLLEPLVVEGEVSGKNYAYLSDRVAVAEGRPQLYGTQFMASGKCVAGFKPT